MAQTLRAFLAFDPIYERLTRELAASGQMYGFGELIYSAFVTAARRRFVPAWTSAQIVRYTARTRNALRPAGVGLDPAATEILIRQALGHPFGTRAGPSRVRWGGQEQDE